MADNPMAADRPPNDDYEGIDNGEPQSDDCNDQVPGDPAGGLHGPRTLG